MVSDSVEEGDKLVQTALENFGRIGEHVRMENVWFCSD
jgi:hypothetical protein